MGKSKTNVGARENRGKEGWGACKFCGTKPPQVVQVGVNPKVFERRCCMAAGKKD
jgi:hypothetical protein